MAKRQQDTQLTKENYEGRDPREDEGGGPDSTTDPVKLASSEVMKGRTIKQPKSRFSAAGATIPRPSVPQPGLSFTPDTTSNTPSTPAPTSNGNVFNMSGATPATPAPKTPFAGFPTLNGGTPATPAQSSPTKSANPFASLASTTPATPAPPSMNPFAALNTTTPAGKPPMGLFGSTTPAGMPAPPTAMPAPPTAMPAPLAGMPAPPKGPLKFGGSTISIPRNDEKSPSVPKVPGFTVKMDTIGGGNSQPLFGGLSTANIFGKAGDEKEKTKNVVDTEKKMESPFTGIFSQSTTASGFTPSFTPSKSSAVNSSLFGNVPSTASKGLFGTDAKIGDTKKPENGLFGSKSNSSSAPVSGLFTTKKAEELPKSISGSLFGVKAPISLNAPSSDTGGVSYPTLPSGSTPNTAAASSITNGDTITGADASVLMQLDADIPPPPENFTKEEQEQFDKLFRIRTLNATILKALEKADAAGDWRGAFRVYDQLYEQIMHGTKRKDESQTDGPGSTPKRSRTDEPKAAGSAAALFGAIVDKNVGSPMASAPKKDDNQPKFIFGAPKVSASTPEKSASSSLFGNTFTTPASVPTNANSTTPTPPKMISNIFGSGGGTTPPSSGGLFSNLKPVFSGEKDKGEEDSPEKPKSAGLLFGAKPTESTAPPPAFMFQAPKNAESPSRVGGDQTWKPDTPIKFGSAATSSGLFGSSTTTPSTAAFTFTKASSADGASSDVPKPFSFTPSLAPPAVSRSTSFDGVTTSGFTTPGTAGSDAESSAAASKPGSGGGNEPSDEVRTEKTDLSGPGPGEENDEVLYTVRVAVYVKDDKGEMKKIAVGASRVLKDKTTGRARFLVRTEQGKVALNVSLQPNVDYLPLPQKKVIMIPDFTSGGSPKTYMVRMKEPAHVSELARIIADVKG